MRDHASEPSGASLLRERDDRIDPRRAARRQRARRRRRPAARTAVTATSTSGSAALTPNSWLSRLLPQRRSRRPRRARSRRRSATSPSRSTSSKIARALLPSAMRMPISSAAASRDTRARRRCRSPTGSSATTPKLSDSSTGERRLTSDFSIRCSIVCDVEHRQLAIEAVEDAAHGARQRQRIAGGLDRERHAATRRPAPSGSSTRPPILRALGEVVQLDVGDDADDGVERRSCR